eukprot:17541-Heterococcus_DN1.PRE.2
MCSNEEKSLLTNEHEAACNRNARLSEEGLTPLSLPLHPNSNCAADSDEVIANSLPYRVKLLFWQYATFWDIQLRSVIDRMRSRLQKDGAALQAF